MRLVNLLEYICVFRKCIVRRWIVLQAHFYYLYLTAIHIKAKLNDLCYTYTLSFWDMFHSITKNNATFVSSNFHAIENSDVTARARPIDLIWAYSRTRSVSITAEVCLDFQDHKGGPQIHRKFGALLTSLKTNHGKLDKSRFRGAQQYPQVTPAGLALCISRR